MAFINIDTARMPTVEGAAFLDAATLFEIGIQIASQAEGAGDLVAAHMYLNLADRAGDERAAWHRQEVAGQMTKSDLARALRGARAIVAGAEKIAPAKVAPVTIH